MGTSYYSGRALLPSQDTHVTLRSDSLLHPCSKFFIDNTGEGSVGGTSPKPVSQEDKARINQRINRFGKQVGNDGNKKKLSIDDMVKSVVSF